jgi:hypothetical protein
MFSATGQSLLHIPVVNHVKHTEMLRLSERTDLRTLFTRYPTAISYNFGKWRG